MRFVIVTGVSGAGKSTVLKMLEDAHYFCVDNLPIPLVEKFASLMLEVHEEGVQNAALGIDARSGRSLEELAQVLDHMKEAGYDFEILFMDAEDSVLVKGASTLRKANIKTLPYPGFPTDMQPQMGVLLCIAKGTSVITEGIYDNRFKYVNELRKMGAEVQVDGRVAVFEGGTKLTGAPVLACDLRAGAAMVIAGLCASGVTEVEDIHYIERGYENFVGKLKALGADIEIVDFPDDNDGAEKIISVC